MRARETTLLQIAAIVFLSACSAPPEITSSASTGAGPTDPGEQLPPPSSPAALMAACTEYHAAHREWFQRCEGYDLGQSRVDSLTRLCVTHATLPGMTVRAERLTECAASFGAASCGYLPPQCLTVEGSSNLTSEGASRPTRTWSVRTFPMGGVGPYYDYALFPRSQGTSPAGTPCDFFPSCSSKSRGS